MTILQTHISKSESKNPITATLMLFSLFLFIFTSCNNEELEKTKNENIRLKTELDSLKSNIKKDLDKKKLFGEYINQKKGIYHSINIKGETSVVVTDGIIGLPFATSYERDGQILRIRTDKSDLILTIKDNTTLTGEGFAEGTYIKEE